MLVLMLIVIQRHPQRWHKAKNDSGTTNVCLDSRSGVVAVALSVGVRFRSGSQSGSAGVAGLSLAIFLHGHLRCMWSGHRISLVTGGWRLVKGMSYVLRCPLLLNIRFSGLTGD